MNYTLPSKAERDVFYDIVAKRKAEQEAAKQKEAEEKARKEHEEFMRKTDAKVAYLMDSLLRTIRGGNSRKCFLSIEETPRNHQPNEFVTAVGNRILECIRKYNDQGYKATITMQDLERFYPSREGEDNGSYYVPYYGVLVTWE